MRADISHTIESSQPRKKQHVLEAVASRNLLLYGHTCATEHCQDMSEVHYLAKHPKRWHVMGIAVREYEVPDEHFLASGHFSPGAGLELLELIQGKPGKALVRKVTERSVCVGKMVNKLCPYGDFNSLNTVENQHPQLAIESIPPPYEIESGARRKGFVGLTKGIKISAEPIVVDRRETFGKPNKICGQTAIYKLLGLFLKGQRGLYIFHCEVSPEVKRPTKVRIVERRGGLAEKKYITALAVLQKPARKVNLIVSSLGTLA